MTTILPSTDLSASTERLRAKYETVRKQTDWLCEPLAIEDYVVQSMEDVSPTRWHLAHTTWFFETFVLKAVTPDYEPWNDAFEYLFNSYYHGIGRQFPRAQRGLLSRPTVAEVRQYRQAIDEVMLALLADFPVHRAHLLPMIELGLQHEQQHQELILTDIKHVFAQNPLLPAYRARPGDDSPRRANAAGPLAWVEGEHGVHWIGYDSPSNASGGEPAGHQAAGGGFAFDNESPRHRAFLPPHRLATRLVTCGEYLEFIDSGGYQRPELWLSLGWQTADEQQWTAPLYWIHRDGRWWQFTLAGLEPLDPCEPVCHVSYFEADAFARWAGARLPTEAEWETAAARVAGQHAAGEAGEPGGSSAVRSGNFVETRRLHPAPATSARAGSLTQLFGDLWEWTSSSYSPYPGYAPAAGAIGEYNGKFMCNQYVLRGGSCATPADHIRPTYRNFFPPAARWQFSGIRLAQ